VKIYCGATEHIRIKQTNFFAFLLKAAEIALNFFLFAIYHLMGNFDLLCAFSAADFVNQI